LIAADSEIDCVGVWMQLCGRHHSVT